MIILTSLVAKAQTETPAPGSDRDSHGCIPSAGYTWSEVLQKCIRIWEEGTALNLPNDKTKAAYIVRSAEGSQVEAYLPDGIQFVMKKSGNTTYTHDDYMLDTNIMTLKKGDTIVASNHVPQETDGKAHKPAKAVKKKKKKPATGKKI